jgi:hypothetical protein
MFLVVVSTREFLARVETGVAAKPEDDGTPSSGAVKLFVGLAWLPGDLLSTAGSAVLVGAAVGRRGSSCWLVAVYDELALGVKDASEADVWR